MIVLHCIIISMFLETTVPCRLQRGFVMVKDLACS
jgi:hypothetical protein